jgi:hypothetical protein
MSAEIDLARRMIAIDAMPYSVNTTYAATRTQLGDRRDRAAAAGARAQAAVPTGAVRQARGPAAGLAKQGDARRVGNGEIDEPSPHNVSRAMNAVTTALAGGAIMLDEAATFAGVYETFGRTAGTAKKKVARGNLLQILTAGEVVEDEDEDIGDAEACDDCDPYTAPADGGR